MRVKNVWNRRQPIYWPVAIGQFAEVLPGDTCDVGVDSLTQQVCLKVFIDQGMLAVLPDPATIH